MGGVCAIVYLLTIVTFIPIPFYKDIVAATSGGGNRDVVVSTEQVETGRFLHRFPHSKARYGRGFHRHQADQLDSWLPTFRLLSLYSTSPCSELSMTCWTSVGVIKS